MTDRRVTCFAEAKKMITNTGVNSTLKSAIGMLLLLSSIAGAARADGGVCGDDTCDAGEDCASCPDDCACPAGDACLGATCITPTIQWDGGGDGSSWCDADNWTGDTLPGRLDDVLIDGAVAIAVTIPNNCQPDINSLSSEEAIIKNGANETVTIATASQINNTYTHNDGTLVHNGDLTVSGVLTWYKGSIVGGAATALYVPAGIVFDGPSSKNLYATTLVIDNTGNLTDGTISLKDGAHPIRTRLYPKSDRIWNDSPRWHHREEQRDAFLDKDSMATPGRRGQSFQLDSGLGGGAVRFGQPETAHVMRRM